MTDYVKSTNFASKDSLASGNPLKIVKGTEIDTEFNNIATAVATKADLASPTFTGTPTLPSGTIATTQTSTDSSTKLATTAFVQTLLQALYPVGSIYSNATNSTNPGTLFGFGTWAAFGAGRVPVGYDATNSNFNASEKTGGSANAVVPDHIHSSTVTDPGHSHTFTNYSTSSGGSTTPIIGSSNTTTTNTTNSATTGITIATGNAASSTSYTVTISIATPGVITFSGSAPANGTKIVLNTTGALPTGYTKGTEYFVVNSSGSTCQLSTTSGGSAINTSGSQSGTHTLFVLTGASTTDANLQPYITVYMWKRTA